MGGCPKTDPIPGFETLIALSLHLAGSCLGQMSHMYIMLFHRHAMNIGFWHKQLFIIALWFNISVRKLHMSLVWYIHEVITVQDHILVHYHPLVQYPPLVHDHLLV